MQPAAGDEMRLERCFRAVVLLPGDAGTEGEEVTSLLRTLAARGVVVVVNDTGAPGPRPDPDRIDPSVPIRSEPLTADLTSVASRRQVFDALAGAGIHPSDVLVAGGTSDVPEGTTPVPPARLRSALREQQERREDMSVPDIASDPSWTLVLDGASLLPRVRETLCALADGRTGTRGSAEEEPPGSDPRVLALGVYDDEEPPGLLVGPRWTRLDLDVPVGGEDTWTLNLRAGILTRHLVTDQGTLRTLRFVSLARPGCAVLRAEAPMPFPAGDPLVSGPPGSTEGGTALAATSSRGMILAAGRDRTGRSTDAHTLERLAGYVSSTTSRPEPAVAAQRLSEMAKIGSDRLLAEHALTWARRWQDAEVRIEGDPDSELSLRFALFHLMSSAPLDGEAAVGARGLTGPAYRGHVFWETDVYVLPVLAATLPDAARAILEYRVRRLPAARRAAEEEGAAGARFPWESAHEGVEVTPRHWTGPEGEAIPVRTATDELHVVADVAWAAHHYARWTGDEAFAAGPGRDLILDTARYWASRADWEGDRAHLRGVMGPDEYHHGVDDNAFTNIMARANLRWAADLADRHGGAGEEEVRRWRRLAAALVDGYDPATGVYEQFAGYSALEPVDILDLARPPVAAELLLGPEAVARTQILKQADVLMLHHLVPDETVPGSLEPNLDRYLRHTAHGSSLSPPIHASLLARAGRVEEALDWFRLTGRLDLEDLTGTAAGGVHLGAMGGLWQALTFGFVGTRVEGDALRFDPRLPRAWKRVEQRLVVRGARLRVVVAPQSVEVESDRPVWVTCGDGPISDAGTRFRFRKTAAGWKEMS